MHFFFSILPVSFSSRYSVSESYVQVLNGQDIKKIYTSSPSPQLHTPLCHVKETDQPWASIINIVDYISFTCIIHFFHRGQLSVSFFFARLYILVCIFDPPVRMIILSSFFARSDDFIFGC